MNFFIDHRLSKKPMYKSYSLPSPPTTTGVTSIHAGLRPQVKRIMKGKRPPTTTARNKERGNEKKGGGARVKGLLLFLWTVTEGGEVEIGKSEREREKRGETMNDPQISML